jgi:putative phosphoesterase
MLVGLISDTHGQVRPEALAALQGSQLIIHAGDIGKPEVLDELRAIAPTFAVRGNNDTGAWAAVVPDRAIVEAGERQICVLHQVGQLFREPAPGGCAAVVFGHTHKPLVETRNGVLYINPGSAGPRRFKLPVTVGRLWVTRARLRSEIVELNA